MGGVARRAWARNENSIETSIHYNQTRPDSDHITLPFIADGKMVEGIVNNAFKKLEK
jgi:urocanate hydratase